MQDHRPGLTAGVFVGAEVVLEVSFGAACAGLARVAGGGWLRAVSADAYGQWDKDLARVGPLGSGWGVSRLVEVRFRDLVTHGRSALLTLRWEAVGPGGGLFPVLDADLTLLPYKDSATLLALSGAYRPPLGAVGAALDRVVLRRVAEATIRRFVNQIGDAVVKLATEPAGGESRPAIVNQDVRDAWRIADS